MTHVFEWCYGHAWNFTMVAIGITAAGAILSYLNGGGSD